MIFTFLKPIYMQLGLSGRGQAVQKLTAVQGNWNGASTGGRITVTGAVEQNNDNIVPVTAGGVVLDTVMNANADCLQCVQEASGPAAQLIFTFLHPLMLAVKSASLLVSVVAVQGTWGVGGAAGGRVVVSSYLVEGEDNFQALPPGSSVIIDTVMNANTPGLMSIQEAGGNPSV